MSLRRSTAAAFSNILAEAPVSPTSRSRTPPPSVSSAYLLRTMLAEEPHDKENTATTSHRVYNPKKHDPPGLSDAEPDDTGRNYPDLPASEPLRCGEGARIGPGEPEGSRDHPAVELRTRDFTLPHGAERDPLRLPLRVPVRL